MLCNATGAPAPACAGGSVVTVLGRNFTNATAVQFAGGAAGAPSCPVLEYRSAEELTCALQVDPSQARHSTPASAWPSHPGLVGLRW